MKMIQRSFEAGDGKGTILIWTAFSAMPSMAPASFAPGCLEFKNELIQAFARLLRLPRLTHPRDAKFHGAFKTAMLQRVPQFTVFSANPVDSIASWVGFERRFVERLLASGIHFIDAKALFFRFFVS